jgi:hypothetical protein
MKVYLVIGLTIAAYGFYWLTDRLLRMRRARREIRERKRWWREMRHAYHLEEEAEHQILGV